MDKIVQGVLIIIIVLGSGYLAYSFVIPISDTPEVIEFVVPVDNTEEIDTHDWQTYRNEKLGFELSYPNEWGVPVDEYTDLTYLTEESSFIDSKGDMSIEKFLLTFPSIDIQIMAVSSNFSFGGDGPWISNEQGYVEIDGEYYTRWSGEPYQYKWSEGDVAKLMTSNSEIIYVQENTFDVLDGTVYGKWFIASFNLNNSEYSGVGVLQYWTPEDSAGLEASEQQFEEFLRTFSLISQ